MEDEKIQTLRKQIQEIQKDTSLSNVEKAKKIQVKHKKHCVMNLVIDERKKRIIKRTKHRRKRRSIEYSFHCSQ